ncbi:MAG: adaptor protein MecA [Lachnospiraceae bacterium]|nr:adaptor protein MecA [Lachnospiraceae bacterium]MCR5267157.1 adaptor protein MecA [Lachnospiraceae bacterium]
MKLEKVNDHQIRATLTKADLADRELKLSELAYGTEKAKSLFRDMMQQAAYEFGFEAEDIPLMIEAIPLSSESIVLIITKVEDPEELDTRFSNFAPTIHEDDESGLNNVLQALSDESDNVLDLFRKIRENAAGDNAVKDAPAPASGVDKDNGNELMRAYSFADIDTAARVAHLLEPFYFGKSSLFRNTNTGRIVLVVTKSSHTPEDFNRVCNMISEYGVSEKYTAASEAYFKEHNDMIMQDDALTKLLFV